MKSHYYDGVTDLTSGIGRVAITQWKPRGICVVKTNDPLKCLLVFPCAIVMIHGQIQQLPQKTMVIRTSYFSGSKVWSHYQLSYHD